MHNVSQLSDCNDKTPFNSASYCGCFSRTNSETRLDTALFWRSNAKRRNFNLDNSRQFGPAIFCEMKRFWCIYGKTQLVF